MKNNLSVLWIYLRTKICRSRREMKGQINNKKQKRREEPEDKNHIHLTPIAPSWLQERMVQLAGAERQNRVAAPLVATVWIPFYYLGHGHLGLENYRPYLGNPFSLPGQSVPSKGSIWTLNFSLCMTGGITHDWWSFRPFMPFTCSSCNHHLSSSFVQQHLVDFMPTFFLNASLLWGCSL